MGREEQKVSNQIGDENIDLIIDNNEIEELTEEEQYETEGGETTIDYTYSQSFRIKRGAKKTFTVSHNKHGRPYQWRVERRKRRNTI